LNSSKGQIILLISLFFVTINFVNACSCPKTKNMTFVEFTYFNYIGYGEIKSIDTNGDIDLVVQIEKTLKGFLTFDTILVKTSSQIPACGYANGCSR